MLYIDETDLVTRIYICSSGQIGIVDKNIKLDSEICYRLMVGLWESHLCLWL